jgi:hypothetical protein
VRSIPDNGGAESGDYEALNCRRDCSERLFCRIAGQGSQSLHVNYTYIEIDRGKLALLSFERLESRTRREIGKSFGLGTHSRYMLEE